MPLYDCMLLLKPTVSKESLIDLVSRVGKHVYKRNGVVVNITRYCSTQSSDSVALGYGIKKLDGRHYKGQLMKMTVMTPPSFNSELSYLNKEDRLLRWILVKHRDVSLGRENSFESGMNNDDLFSRRLFGQEQSSSSSSDDEYPDDDAYVADQSGTNEA